MNKEEINVAIYRLKNIIQFFFDKLDFEEEVDIYFLGSQAILMHNRDIKEQEIIQSQELDVIILGKSNSEIIKEINKNIEYSYGYGSPFEEDENFSIDVMTDYDNIENNFKNFPINWRDRALIIEDNEKHINCIVPSIEDLCALKLNAYREKDIVYVQKVIQGSLIKKKRLMNALNELPHIDKEKLSLIKEKVKQFFKNKQINILQIDNKQKKLKI